MSFMIEIPSQKRPIESHPQTGKKKRRTPLSCVTCRNKKIKCDRSKPKCLRCINSKIECVYDSPVMWSDISDEQLNLGREKHANSPITFISSLGHSCNTTTTTTTTTKTTRTTNQALENQFESSISSPIYISSNNNNAFLNPPSISVINKNIIEKSNKPILKSESYLNRTAPFSNDQTEQQLQKIGSFADTRGNIHNSQISIIFDNTNAVNIPPVQNFVSIQNIPLPTSVVDKVSEIEYLKNRLAALQHSFENSFECISLVLDDDNKPSVIFRSKKDSRFMCLGTFINSGVWRRDPLMNSFFNIFFDMKKSVSKPKRYSKDLVNNHKNKYKLIHKYYLHGDPYSKKSPVPPIRLYEFLNNQVMTKKSKVKMYDNTFFIQEIEQMLPPWDVILFHIDRFMKYIYPFIPVIDEHIFRLNISKILIYPTINDVSDSMTGVKIMIGEKSDTLRLSLLLLIMRLSYLSVYLEIEMTNQRPTIPQQRILSYPIGPDTINLVQFSLHNTNFLRKTSVETFQVLLLLRFYQLKGCEDGDGYLGSDGTTFQGLIKATAKNIGLNQQFDENISLKPCFSQVSDVLSHSPDTPLNLANTVRAISDEYPDINKLISPDLQCNLLTRGPVVFNQLWKKLWWTSLTLDLHHSMTYGSTPQFDHDPKMSKTGNSIFNPEFSNAQNLEIEKFSTNRLEYFSKINFPIYQLLEMLHNFKVKPTVIQVEAKMDEIIRLADKTFDNSNCSRFVSPSLFVSYKVNNITSKLEVYGFLLIIQYNLLLHCEKLGIKEKSGYRSESLGFANDRFTKLFPNFFSSWLFIIESIILVWKKICGYSIVTTNDEINNNHIKGDFAEFSSYIILIAPIINIIFAKLMSSLFYISVRLFIFHYKLKENKNNLDMTSKKIEKIDELLKLYHHLITLFKILVVMEAKLSKFWYPSLRLYTMFRKGFEWFEGGEKFMPNSYTAATTQNFSNNVNQSNTICIIPNDTNAQDSAKIVEQFFFHIDTSIIKTINLKIENLIVTHNLEKINSTYENVFPKADLNSEHECASNASNFEYTSSSAAMMENVFGSDNKEEVKTNNLTPESDKCTGAVDNNINFLESLEMDDWDDLSKWFNQPPILDSIDSESPRKEFRHFM